MNSRSSGKCLSENEIEDFLFDRLSGVTREVVEEHLLVCQDCLRKVEAEEQYVQAVRSAARTLESEQLERAFQTPEPAPRRAPAWNWQRWGLALAGAAALLVFVVVQYRPSGTMTENEIALRLDRSAVAVAAEAVHGRALRLTPDLAGLTAAELEWVVVDAGGSSVAQGRFTPGQGASDIKLPRGLAAGAYWVRIKIPGGSLLREFALQVR